ncbi:MAG: peptidoglycan-binding domain-containing protein [Cyanobacteria bacterium P01_B01_bin.77]
MPKLLTAAFVSGMLAFWGLPSQAQTRLLTPPALPPTPSISSPAVVRRSLGFGDFGRDVEALQRALVSNGINPGPIDGDYGTLTREAVREFQQVYDLPVTGIADQETLNGLGVSIGEEFASNDLPYVAAVTEPPRYLGRVQRVFGNAVVDSARQGEFINIGRYDSRSSAAERVREARRSGFDARILYQR